jgi:hypothetical protein
VGVEFNPFFTKLQSRIVKKYKMDSRVKVGRRTREQREHRGSKESEVGGV